MRSLCNVMNLIMILFLSFLFHCFSLLLISRHFLYRMHTSTNLIFLNFLLRLSFVSLWLASTHTTFAQSFVILKFIAIRVDPIVDQL